MRCSDTLNPSLTPTTRVPCDCNFFLDYPTLEFLLWPTVSQKMHVHVWILPVKVLIGSIPPSLSSQSVAVTCSQIKTLEKLFYHMVRWTDCPLDWLQLHVELNMLCKEDNNLKVFLAVFYHSDYCVYYPIQYSLFIYSKGSA